MQDTQEAAATIRGNSWQIDDPSIGSPFDPGQAVMAARWDVRHFWKSLAKKHGLGENAAMVAVELYQEALGDDRWTSYSRTDTHYARFPKSSLYTKRRIVGGVDELEEAGLVWNWKQVRDGRDWQSCVKAKPALVDLVRGIVDAGNRPYPTRPKSPLELRDADGKPIPFRKTAETQRMVDELYDYNGLLRSTIVSGGHATCVRRVFNETLKNGGRHYCIGLSFQRMSKKDRALLTIDGYETVEFDYGSIHPCLLYKMAGLALPEDAYDLPWFDRDLQKTAFMVLINADDEDQALHSIAGKKEMARIAVPGSDDALRVAAALYSEMKDRHRAISEFFATGVGRQLQRQDSDMMAMILAEMTKRRELVLPVFDACRVRETAWEVIQDVMRKVADKVGLYGVRIETVEPKAGEKLPKPEEPILFTDPVNAGRAEETSRLMLSLPSSFSPLPPSFQNQALTDGPGGRESEANGPREQAAGRSSSSLDSSSVPDTETPEIVSPAFPVAVYEHPFDADTDLNALRIDPTLIPSDPASDDETAPQSSYVASRVVAAPFSFAPLPNAFVPPTDTGVARCLSRTASMYAFLERDRHMRAAAAAQAVVRDPVDPHMMWTATRGVAVVQQTHRGEAWTWTVPGRSERLVLLANASSDTLVCAPDQRTASEVVETYLRALSGPGCVLRIHVVYAGTYDTRLSYEQNVERYKPITDVIVRPSLLPGAPFLDSSLPEMAFETDIEGWREPAPTRPVLPIVDPVDVPPSPTLAELAVELFKPGPDGRPLSLADLPHGAGRMLNDHVAKKRTATRQKELL